MDITQDIRPLTEFKRDTSRFMTHLRDTGRPSILTVNGKPALVVMDAEAWQDMQDRLEYDRTVEAIRKGLDDMEHGRGTEASVFFDKLASDEG